MGSTMQAFESRACYRASGFFFLDLLGDKTGRGQREGETVPSSPCAERGAPSHDPEIAI